MNLHEGVPLSKYTTLGTGGPAHRLGNPGTVDELVEMLAWAREEELPVAAVGLGSNLLAADEGYPGPRRSSSAASLRPRTSRMACCSPAAVRLSPSASIAPALRIWAASSSCAPSRAPSAAA